MKRCSCIGSVPRSRSSRKTEFQKRLEKLENKITGVSEKRALDILEGEDMMIANHVFYEVFGHNIPKEYR